MSDSKQTEQKPSRRKFLAAAATGSVGAVAAGFPMISVAQSPITMRWQSTWPAKDIFHEYANDFAHRVNEMAGGKVRIDVLPSGAVVKAFDLLDAVDVRTAMPGARCHDELLVSRGGEEIGGVMRRAKIGNQRLLIKEELESSQIIVIMVLAVVAASDREGDEPLLGLLLKDRHLLIG